MRHALVLAFALALALLAFPFSLESRSAFRGFTAIMYAAIIH